MPPVMQKIGYAMLIPMFFLAGPCVGFVFGWWVDAHWGTDPWGKAGLSILGFVASVRQVIQLIQRMTGENRK